ncbi:DUF7657 domain-containing protein [Comamonas odontotermitis]|uniref:DUF7657 domain-containing protein n=1 Tax=Comamonas odontotermitis TaxID=379895 RepID=UPI001CC38566|nr:hypothetical protein [Comamonas odontotermitis]UBB16729.1 hypothetical protein LAD35_18360 [Comamonas odontotermitis]
MKLFNSKNIIFFILFILIGFIYIANTWSPSSYAHVLKNHFSYEEVKPDFGKSRPVRSDEWAVVTPLTQALVRNDYKRYNETSLYQEDLRINYGLPIADWGIIFKPTMWLYGHVNPAYAYSFHWFAIFSLFIVGYSFLFKKFGASNVAAISLSFGLYFTGFSQFWWNEKGPIIAYFPWVVIPFFLKTRIIWKLVLFYYFSVAWLLTNLYPPIQISLAFVGFIILLIHHPKLFRLPSIIYIAIAAALAAGTAGLYLKDYLIATSATLYPGGRHSMGGDVPFRFVISWLFPGLNFTWGYRSLIGLNISEIGVVGMYYYIVIAFFLNYKNFGEIWNNSSKRKIFLILTTAFILQLSWMILPIPSKIGMFLLWDNVQPSRMQFASGVTLILLALYTVSNTGIILSLRRLILLSGFIIAAWWAFKQPYGIKRFEDLVFIPIIIVAYAISKKRASSHHEAIALSSMIFGAILFGRFNPLQSAWPIFNIPQNQTIRHLQELQDSNNGVLVFPGLPGSIANGMGFRSLSHTTPTPHMEFWKKHFPEIPSDQLNLIFNRYSHINPAAIPYPKLLQADAIAVPINRFTKTSQVIEVSHYPENLPNDGYFSLERKSPDIMQLNGWAGWKGATDSHGMEIIFDSKLNEKIEMISILRPDLPKNTNQRISALNGFQIMIPRSDVKNPTCITLISVDRSTGERRLLTNPPEIPLCQSFSSQ